MGNDAPIDDSLVRLSHWRYGDYDERPVHDIGLTQPYYVGSTPVTNAQYEEIFPEHRALRGKLDFSTDDDEAVVFVNWHDAVAFCEALSERDGLPYRLPTEAEWEYACRAGTTTAYWTGDVLPDEYLLNSIGQSWYPVVRDHVTDRALKLHVGRTPANPWGLHDMHGLVEEWCSDWYDLYGAQPCGDPVGPESADTVRDNTGHQMSDREAHSSIGNHRVTRGGSHSTEAYYLRSANRSGNLPTDSHWYIGLRVVIGTQSEPGKRIWKRKAPLHAADVRATAWSGTDAAGKSSVPVFGGPYRYMKVKHGEVGPLFGTHNHCPGLAVCPNGDMMAIWYSCVEEHGRELCIAASRRRYDHSAGKLADEWDEPSLFWNTPGKNDHASALWSDGKRMYHFNGLSAGATWGPLATILRTSDDSGATWSEARLIIEEHGPRHMPIAGVFALRDGTIVLPCDAVAVGSGGSALWLSEDHGETWFDPGGTIAGIHAGVVELADGRLFAFGRGDDIDGRMAQSVSSDRGATWEYSASPFPGVDSSQRVVLRRMRGTCEHGTDPLVLVSFSNPPMDSVEAQQFTDAAGVRQPLQGLFAAVSFDDGETWPFARPVSDGLPTRLIAGMDGREDEMGPDRAERLGYCVGEQSQDGLMHVITSMNEYECNLAWLSERPTISGSPTRSR
ncbi:MAG: SUMF1/EgtB/PvdO family nonheme iron enzyme [Gemmatimonadetes bacterium]|nr:SUMF1/EgtB/PvdO family nonheme iron enzyme [Gemmatimonadota bacterium]